MPKQHIKRGILNLIIYSKFEIQQKNIRGGGHANQERGGSAARPPPGMEASLEIFRFWIKKGNGNIGIYDFADARRFSHSKFMDLIRQSWKQPQHQQTEDRRQQLLVAPLQRRTTTSSY